MKRVENGESKRSASFPDVSSMLKRQRSDLERKLRNLHFVHCVEKVELIDQYDPDCWVCQKESNLVKDLKSTLAEHRRLGILDDELQLLNKGYQKWILSLEAGHNNCSTKAVTISNAIKKALFNKSSDSLPGKLEKEPEEKEKMIREMGESKEILLRKPTSIFILHFPPVCVIYMAGGFLFALVEIRAVKIGSQQSQHEEQPTSSDSREIPAEELAEKQHHWIPRPIARETKRPSQKNVQFVFEDSDQEEQPEMPAKKRPRNSEPGVIVRDEESLTEYFKPATPTSQKRRRLTERQKEVLSSKKDKLPFIDDDTQQTSSNSISILKKRLPAEYLIDSQQDSENLSQNAMDALPIREEVDEKRPLKDSLNSQEKAIGPTDFSCITVEKSPSKSPRQPRSPLRLSCSPRVESPARKSVPTTPKGAHSKKNTPKSERRKSPARVLRPRSPAGKVIGEENALLTDEESEGSLSDRPSEKKPKKKRQYRKKNDEAKETEKGDHLFKEKVDDEKKRSDDEAKRIRKERIQAMLGKNKECEKAANSPTPLVKTKSSSNMGLVLPQIVKKIEENGAKMEETNGNEAVEEKKVKETSENKDDLAPKATENQDEKKKNEDVCEKVDEPQKESAVLIEKVAKEEKTEDPVESKEEKEELNKRDESQESVIIVDEVLKTPPKSAGPPKVEGTPQSILRKDETPKSHRSERRVTFSAESDRRFRPRKVPAADCIAPDLVFCNESITSMCMRLAPKKQGIRLDNVLKRKSIWTIGDFAGLSPSVIKQVPFIKEPKLENVHNFLTSYKPSTSSSSQEKPPVQSTPRAEEMSPAKSDISYASTLNETPIKKRNTLSFEDTTKSTKSIEKQLDSETKTVEESRSEEIIEKPESQEMEVESVEKEKVNEDKVEEIDEAVENVEKPESQEIPPSPEDQAKLTEGDCHTPVKANNTSKRICTPMPSRSVLAMLSTADDDFYDDSILEGFEMPKESEKKSEKDQDLSNKDTKQELEKINEKLDRLLEIQPKKGDVDLNQMDAISIVNHLHAKFLEFDPPPSRECNLLSAALCQFMNTLCQRQLLNNAK
ncbi:unnamed protein product [Bursaphelenchus xylophilus]|uniref:(pine wood nematode) hypothetical protein n=1 Tax=Bursaphelenchus xylophilus TaxID=6326 RepID=A0A1I7SBP1_BURXY|nr:unnamed protein product [Bursaphelenchus xylophilus]CAG9114533.1 unnamed protein product [Bursaphelenchus xylophilus]